MPARRPRRFELADRWLPWLAGAVLVAGVAFFAVSRLGGGGGGSPAEAPPTPKPVPLAAAAKQVAYRFVDTAVARKRLAAAYGIVTPRIREGMTLAAWTKGTIAVAPYPVGEAVQRWHVLGSYPNRAQLEVAFLPKSGSSAQPAIFSVGLLKLRGRWLVDSWTPRQGIQAPAG